MIFINYYTIDETCFHFFAKTCLFIYPTYAPAFLRKLVVLDKCQYCLVRMSGKKRSYEIAFKLKVVEFAEKESNRSAGRKFQVDERRVREWRSKKAELDEHSSKKKRLPGAGRKAVFSIAMEEDLVEWMETSRRQHLRVTCNAIQRNAAAIYDNHSLGDGEPAGPAFAASRGWLEKFLKRQEFTIRRRTTVSQRLPRELVPKVVGFIMHLHRRLFHERIPISAIGNMDETPCCLDMPGETTVEHVGARSVPLRTTGHEKSRFTVVLAAMADGRKLKPFVVLKGVRPIAELARISGVVVAYSRNGWMNEQLKKDWVMRVWGSFSFGKRILVWDAYRCHIMDSVKSIIKHRTNSEVSIIPAGLTKQLQPADISWNKPFKEAYRKLYDEWMATGEKSFTPAGNMRAPSKPLVVQWVKTAWDAVGVDVIKKSFIVSGIALHPDGSEDNNIRCIQTDGVAAQAKEEITRQTALLTQDEDENDPFLDCEDDEELENNETVIDDDDN